MVLGVIGVGLLVACGESPASPADAASIDVRPTPLACVPAAALPQGCSDVPLPALVGTWHIAGSSKLQRWSYSVRFAPAPDEPCLAGQALPDPSYPGVPSPTGLWAVSRSVATMQHGYGSGGTMEMMICWSTSSGLLRITGNTRVPGFHTAYETIDYFMGTLDLGIPGALTPLDDRF